VNRADGIDGERWVSIRDESDVAIVRKHVREIGRLGGLAATAVDALATAISEVSRNALVHAEGGEAVIRVGAMNGRRAIVAVVRDQGPGISNVDRAMQDGFSTVGSLGLGLPGARRLADAFEIVSDPGVGTTVMLAMWLPAGEAR